MVQVMSPVLLANRGVPCDEPGVILVIQPAPCWTHQIFQHERCLVNLIQQAAGSEDQQESSKKKKNSSGQVVACLRMIGSFGRWYKIYPLFLLMHLCDKPDIRYIHGASTLVGPPDRADWGNWSSTVRQGINCKYMHEWELLISSGLLYNRR
jgi:hypothetical protein